MLSDKPKSRYTYETPANENPEDSQMFKTNFGLSITNEVSDKFSTTINNLNINKPQTLEFIKVSSNTIDKNNNLLIDDINNAKNYIIVDKHVVFAEVAVEEYDPGQSFDSFVILDQDGNHAQPYTNTNELLLDLSEDNYVYRIELTNLYTLQKGMLTIEKHIVNINNELLTDITRDLLISLDTDYYISDLYPTNNSKTNFSITSDKTIVVEGYFSTFYTYKLIDNIRILYIQIN